MEEGFFVSPCSSFELCVQIGISFLFSFAFHFSSFHSYLKGLLRQPFCLLHLFFLGMVLFTESCTMSQTSLRSWSGTLSHVIPWIYLSLPLVVIRAIFLLQFRPRFIWHSIPLPAASFLWSILHGLSPSPSAKLWENPFKFSPSSPLCSCTPMGNPYHPCISDVPERTASPCSTI